DDVHQSGDLSVVTPGEILSRAHEHRDVLDAGGPAPGQGVPDALRPVPMTVAGAGETLLLRPAPVAVDDQPDMTGQRLAGELAAEPPLIEPDGQAASWRA